MRAYSLRAASYSPARSAWLAFVQDGCSASAAGRLAAAGEPAKPEPARPDAGIPAVSGRWYGAGGARALTVSGLRAFFGIHRKSPSGGAIGYHEALSVRTAGPCTSTIVPFG